MAIRKSVLRRANAARGPRPWKVTIPDHDDVTRKRKKIEFYLGPAPLVFEGTMEIVDGVLKFDIEDKDFLFSVANGPSDIMNGDPEKYYDFVIGQRMMSTTIIMKEVEDKPQKGEPTTGETKSLPGNRGTPEKKG